MDCLLQGLSAYLPEGWTACIQNTNHECLDWQNSQFINIVGKDDNSAAIEVK
jgi:hypothetical protein